MRAFARLLCTALTALLPLTAACGSDGGSASADTASPFDTGKADQADDVAPADSAVLPDSATVDTGGPVDVTPQDTAAADTGGPVDAITADTATGDTTPTDTTPADTTAPPSCPAPPVAPATAHLAGSGRYRQLTGLDVGGLPPRAITILLPPDYDTAPTRRYPVLYMHDGQNLFSDQASAFGEWGVDENVDALVTAGAIAPVIVVGLHNTSERMADYTPTPDTTYGGGNAAAYVAWLADVVKPAVDALLRTQCERDVTGVMGSSLGGLVSFYAALERPEVFGRVGVVSPSFWWDDEVLVSAFDTYAGPLPARLWLDMGTEEGDANGDLTASVALNRHVRDRAMARGLTLGASLGYFEHLGAAHNEAAWRARLPAILRYLYGANPLEPASALFFELFSDHLSTAGRPRTAALVSTTHGAYGLLTVPNPSVAFSVTGDAVTVAADGTVTAVHDGVATLTAQLGGLSASATVTVSAADTAWVTFSVAVPGATPWDANVHIAGSPAALGAWDPAAVPMFFVEETGRWTHSVALPAGAPFKYKYTRGSWATVEADASGQDINDREAIAEPGTRLDAVARWIDQ